MEAAYVWAWDGRPFLAWPLKETVWPEGAVAARVAEIGPDGRTGAWQSCAA